LVDEDTGEVIAREVKLADSFRIRLRGLMFRRRFPSVKAMFLRFRKQGRHGVHTSFKRFPIYSVYPDQDFKVVRFARDSNPGTVDRARLRVGRRVLLEIEMLD
jgi:uncharacterized membrane protein (UPF0127 family)